MGVSRCRCRSGRRSCMCESAAGTTAPLLTRRRRSAKIELPYYAQGVSRGGEVELEAGGRVARDGPRGREVIGQRRDARLQVPADGPGGGGGGGAAGRRGHRQPIEFFTIRPACSISESGYPFLPFPTTTRPVPALRSRDSALSHPSPGGGRLLAGDEEIGVEADRSFAIG